MLAAVALGLWVFRAQANPPVDLNDSGLHLSMTDWLSGRVGDRHNPFDGWYPYLGLGFPQTHHYQSLPHVLTGIAGLAVGVGAAYHWSLYLLLAGWPIAIYGGGRLLGISRWSAAFAAVLAPWIVSVPGYGFESGSYTWQGLGLWPQLWAAWLLPIALGLGWRAVRREGSPVLAGVVIAACTLCHFLTGWLALAVVALFPLLHGTDLRRRFGRLALTLAAAAASIAWFAVPLFLDRSGADYTGYERGTFWYDSYGATQVGRWLVSGELLDAGRLPVLTVLAAIGLIVTALRGREPGASRAVLLLTGLSLVLFFGRPTLGPLLDVLPYGDDLFYPRFIMGVQLGAVLLAGIGVAWMANHALRALDAFGPHVLGVALISVAGLLVLAPVVRDGVRREDRGRSFMESQRRADERGGDDLLALIRSVRGEPGRVYAGPSLGWGASYRIGYVPTYARLLAENVDAVGYALRVSSLPTGGEARFDDTDPAYMTAFGVQWLLMPADRQPSVPATLVGEQGDHRLWRVTSSSGYAEVVDATGPVSARGGPLTDLVTNAFLAGEVAVGRRPLIAWDGRGGAPSTVTGRDGSPGSVDVPIVDAPDGRFTFKVTATRDAYVALAASWHPRWQVTVDGEARPVVMLAPGVAGVAVEVGEHTVAFRYVPFAYTWAILTLGVAALLALWWVPKRSQTAQLASTGRPVAGRHRRDA